MLEREPDPDPLSPEPPSTLAGAESAKLQTRAFSDALFVPDYSFEKANAHLRASVRTLVRFEVVFSRFLSLFFPTLLIARRV